MTRIATIPLQATLTGAMERTQGELAITQQQIASGKKARDFADLGTQSARILSAHTMLTRQEAHKAVAAQVGTALSVYDSSMNSMDAAASDLRKTLLQAIGTGQTTGVQASIDAAFDQFRASLNTSTRGVSLFGGSQTEGTPFTRQKLPDLVGTTQADVFANDDVLPTAELGDGLTIRYGHTASEVGGDLYTAFRTLAEAGTLGTTPDAAQMNKLKQAVGELDTGLARLRTSNANNGRKQNEVETLSLRADERALMWKDLIGEAEDANLADVATKLAQQKMLLEASYSVFSQLSRLSLISYLR